MTGFFQKIKNALLPERQYHKIDFLIIGTQKAGSSVLSRYLNQHRRIKIPKQKELHFFDKEENFENPVLDYKKYERNFKPDKEDKLYGEATPIYMYWEPALRRIRDYNKDIKLIIILRDPSNRAFAHWNREVKRGFETSDFKEALEKEQVRINAARPLQNRVFSYADRSRYAGQIRRILNYFPSERVHFIKYENFVQDPEKTVDDVLNFLGVNPPDYPFKKQDKMEKAFERNMTLEEREYLVSLFKDEILEVENLLNWKCNDWKEASIKQPTLS